MSEVALQLAVAGLATGSVYALIAIGIVMIYNASGVVNFAQGAYAMIGAYAAYALAAGLGLPVPAAAFLATLLLGGLGSLTELLVLRPMLRAPPVAVMMATLGVLIALRGFVLLVFGSDTLPFPAMFPAEGLLLGGVYVTYAYIAAAVVAVVAVSLLVLFYRYTAIGLLQRCAADNPRAALALGVHVSNQVSLAWFLSCALAGFGGVLLATLNGLHVSLSDIGLVAFPVVVLGGLTSLAGAVLAGVALGLLESFTNGALAPALEAWLRAHTSLYSVGALQQVIPYAALVLTLLIRPQGLLGRAGTERV